MATAIAGALKYVRDHKDQVLAELRDFLSIPSVSSNPSDHDEVKRATAWLADRLNSVGMDRVEIVPTKGHAVVYAQSTAAGPSAPTVLIYGHYDVQSAAPLGDWDSDPYRPTIRGDDLFARGASDNKGQIMACVAAVEAVLKSGEAPVNIKFVIEGEEELGSPNFADFLKENRSLLSGDLVLNADVGMLGPDLPTIFCGLRGMQAWKLRVLGPATDLHSGSFGGVVHNPIHALADVIAGLHDDEGRVTLDGFYDDVRPLTPQEREEMERTPRDDACYLRESGVKELWGEPGFCAAEREGSRPALDVVHVIGGSEKSAIPSEAMALITVRLVPDQDPAAINENFVRYLEQRLPSTVEWEVLDREGFTASLTDRDSKGVQSLARAMEEVWGKPPVFCRSGGSIAAVGQIREILGLDSVLTGFALPDAHTHGPNEKLNLPTWEKGVEALVRFLYHMAEA